MRYMTLEIMFADFLWRFLRRRFFRVYKMHRSSKESPTVIQFADKSFSSRFFSHLAKYVVFYARVQSLFFLFYANTENTTRSKVLLTKPRSVS